MIAALNGTGESLTIVLAGAKTTVDANYSVLYDGDNPSPSNPVGNTNGTTAVTMLAGVLNAVRTVRAIHLFNADTGAITATIKKVVSGTGYTRLTVTLQVGDTLVWDANGLRVVDSSGQLRSAAASYTTSVIAFSGATGENEIRLVTNLADALSIEDTAGDLIKIDTTTGTQVITITPAVTFVASLTGPVVIFNGATGANEVRVPTNLADALSIESSAGDIVVLDTSTGAVVWNFSAAVRVNILGSAQIGDATTDLVAFHGSTPTDQCAALVQTFATADRTHAARTAVDLTDNTAGTPADTLEALVSGTVYATDVAAIRNNLASLARAVDRLIVDLADTASFVNSIADDLQEKGISG